MTPENYIKSKLDGNFYSLQCGVGIDAVPTVKRYKVPKNYMPRFDAAEQFEQHQENGKRNGVKARPWSDEEDNALIEMRNRGYRWENVCKELRRGKKGVTARYREICKTRGIKPVRLTATGPANLSTEEKAMIVQLREEGLTFDQISARMGLKGYIARDYYARFRHQQLMMRPAA